MQVYLLLQITPALLPALVLTGMRVNVYFMQARAHAGELRVQYGEIRAPRASYSAGIDIAFAHHGMCSADDPGRHGEPATITKHHDLARAHMLPITS